MKNKLRTTTILINTMALFLGSFIVINAYNEEVIKNDIDLGITSQVENNIEIETAKAKAEYYKSVGTKVDVEATAYTGDTITSTGTVPKWGTIAVDPEIIPYGTKIYIPYLDTVFVAEDCGSAIKGNKIDIFMDNSKSMNDWGRRNIEIYILDESIEIGK
ncbi:MAG: 3D domain-containing protein [Paraclostridium sp.]